MHEKMKNALSNLSVIAAQYVPKYLKASLLDMAKEIDALKDDLAKRKERDTNRARVLIETARKCGMPEDVIAVMQEIIDEMERAGE